jgi:four helix bundle protein
MAKIYKDLNVYKTSYRLAIDLHRLVKRLPILETDVIGKQLLRAAYSIPSNIAEGCARKLSRSDLRGFIKIAAGSNEEVLFNIEVLHDLKLISDEEFDRLHGEYTICVKQLFTLVKSLSKDLKTHNQPTTNNQ